MNERWRAPVAGAPKRDTARAMSEENVEIVRGLYESWNAGDPTFERFAPDIEWDVSRWAPDLREVARGHDEVRELFRRFLGMWDELHFEPHRFIEGGDHVVVSLTVRTRGRASGVPATIETAHVFTLRDGLLASHVQYPNLDEALEAAGLSEC